MKPENFNKKFEKYLEEGHYGLDIWQEDVATYLEKEFDEEIKRNPEFNYAQIKLKFGMARVYANSEKCDEWERTIDKMIANAQSA